MNKRLNAQFYAVLGTAIGHLKGEPYDYAKADIIAQHTSGRTTSASELTDDEAQSIIKALQPSAISKPKHDEVLNKMRRKLIGLARNCGWLVWNGAKGCYEADMPRLEAWVVKYGSENPKKLNDYDKEGLTKLISQFQKVQADLLKPKT
jgi:hypothetical protein